MIPRFRVWVRGFRGFKYCDDIVLNYPRKQIIIYTAFNDMIVEDFDDKLITMSTGLKDKNGKEIFEGDIIKMHDEIYEIKKDYDNCRFCISKNDNTCCEINSVLTLFDVKEIEVIGNIYENPELLERK